MLEATITASNITEFKFGTDQKTGYNVETDQGKFACFSSTEILKVMPGIPVLVRYEEKERGGYTNKNIKQVADKDGNFEAPKTAGGGGGRPAKADPDKMKQDKELEIARNKSIQRQVAAKEATQIMLADVKQRIDDKATFNAWKIWDEAYDHILTKLLEVK